MDRPLVWVALALLTGVIAAAHGYCPGLTGPLLILLLAPVSAVVLRRTRYGRAMAVAFAFTAGGALLWNARHAGPPGDPLARWAMAHPKTEFSLEGRVSHAPVILSETAYAAFTLDVHRVIVDGAPLALTGKVLVRWSDPAPWLFAGTRVEVRGPLDSTLGRVNPGIQDSEDYARRRGVHSSMRVRGAKGVRQTAPAPWWSPAYLASRLRWIEARQFRALVPQQAYPLVLAVWLGERRHVDATRNRAYIASGTAHILSVSGLHMSIIYVSISSMLTLFLKRSRLRSLLTMGAVFLFAFVAGGRIASVRAAIMIALYLSADLAEREPDAPTALSVAAILFLLHNPANVFDPGFQLSFLSIASLLLFSEPIAARLGSIPVRIRKALAAALAVQILPLPVAVHHFHVLPLASPLVNLLVVPLLGILLWLCFAMVATGALVHGLGILFGHALWPVVALIEGVTGIVAQTPWTHATAVSPQPAAVACYWSAVALKGARAAQMAACSRRSVCPACVAVDMESLSRRRRSRLS